LDYKQVSFLKDEFMVLAIGAAFQRANVYGAEAGNDDRRKFREDLCESISTLVEQQYKIKRVSEDDHFKNIQELCNNISSLHGTILNDGRFRVGNCQKLLNLYLKYLWCAGLVDEPPHCPVDRIIIGKYEKNTGINWTEMADIEEYKAIIRKLNSKAKESNMTLARWDLETYGRR